MLSLEIFMLIYFESSVGCGLRKSRDEESARNELRREIGTMNGLTVVQKATPQNVEWVRGMGGYIP